MPPRSTMRCPVSYRTSSVARIVRDGSMRLRRVVAPAKATACRSATSYVEGRCPRVKCTENVAHPPFDAKTRDTVRAIADSRCSSDARSKNTTAVTGVTTARGPCEGGALHSRDVITWHIGTRLVAPRGLELESTSRRAGEQRCRSRIGDAKRTSTQTCSRRAVPRRIATHPPTQPLPRGAAAASIEKSDAHCPG